MHPDPKLDHDDNVYSTRRHTNTSSAAPCELRCCWLLRHRSAHPRVRHRSCQLHCQPSSGSPPSYQLRQHCAALCGCSRPDSTDRAAPCADAAQEAARTSVQQLRPMARSIRDDHKRQHALPCRVPSNARPQVSASCDGGRRVAPGLSDAAHRRGWGRSRSVQPLSPDLGPNPLTEHERARSIAAAIPPALTASSKAARRRAI